MRSAQSEILRIRWFQHDRGKLYLARGEYNRYQLVLLWSLTLEHRILALTEILDVFVVAEWVKVTHDC